MIRDVDPRFKNLERKIGIFIILAITGIVVAALMFGAQKDMFVKKYNLRFTVDRGTGFNKGMSVKLSGFRVGRITSIVLNDQAMVDITIEVDRKYSKWIRNDSTVKLVKEGLVGDNIVEVSVGSLEQPELKEGEAVTYVKTKALDELADDIAEKVKPVLIEVRDIISYINNPDGDLKKTVRNLELLTRNLEKTRKNADTLLMSTSSNLEKISGKTTLLLDTTYGKIDSLDLNATLGRINNTIDQIDKRAPGILEKADNTLANADKVALETRKLAEKVMPRIPGMMSQTEDLLFSTDRLVNSIQNTWLLRDNAPPPVNKGFIRGDSYE